MEGRDGASAGGGGGNMQGSMSSFLQSRPPATVNPAGGLPAALRPPVISSLASPSAISSDGAASPQNLMNIGQGGVNFTGGVVSSPGIGSPNASRTDPQKRKRGRPRKYQTGSDASGQNMGTQLALTPVAIKSPTSPSSEKRGRGRPPGSGKKQQLASLGAWLSGTAGSGFIPHVITVAAGEDVATKIFAFCNQGPRAVCVLSANGSISNVTLRHDSSFGGNITYEGRYEILSLSGSFLPTDVNGARSRTGGLSVSLAASDGKVVGGSVSGLLVAATPVQIVVGSFIVAETPGKARVPTSPMSPIGAGNGESMVSLMTTSIGLSPPNVSQGVTAPVPLATGRPAKTEASSGGSKGAAPSPGGNGAPSPQHSLAPPFSVAPWQPTQVDSGRRATTDINMSLPGG